MCLITNQKEPLVAQEDMVVYKGLTALEDNKAGSIYESFSYILGQLYTTEMQQDDDWCAADTPSVRWLDNNYPNWHRGEEKEHLICIGPGYHSSLTERRISYHRKSDSIYQCTIPKGSLYYTDPTGLIVSNQIIINHIIPAS